MRLFFTPFTWVCLWLWSVHWTQWMQCNLFNLIYTNFIRGTYGWLRHNSIFAFCWLSTSVVDLLGPTISLHRRNENISWRVVGYLKKLDIIICTSFCFRFRIGFLVFQWVSTSRNLYKELEPFSNKISALTLHRSSSMWRCENTQFYSKKWLVQSEQL